MKPLKLSDPGWLSTARTEIAAGRPVEIHVDAEVIKAVVETTQKAAQSGPVKLAVDVASHLLPSLPTLPVNPASLAGFGGLAGAGGAVAWLLGRASAAGMRTEFVFQPNAWLDMGDDVWLVRISK